MSGMAVPWYPRGEQLSVAEVSFRANHTPDIIIKTDCILYGMKRVYCMNRNIVIVFKTFCIA